MAEWLCSGGGSKQVKKKMRLIEHVKALKTEKNTRDYNNIRTCVEGAFVVKRGRDSEDLHKVYLDNVPEGYFHIRHGTVAVMDKTTKDIELVVRCQPFKDMDLGKKTEYEKVTSTLSNMKNGASDVKSNASQRTGNMYAAGWRGGSDPGLTMGRYVPNQSIQGSAAELHNWRYQQSLLAEISTFYGTKFCSLAPSLFDQARTEMIMSQVPNLAELEFNLSLPPKEGNDATFCSNLTYTMDDFSNCFHKDHDKSSYSFGIWAPIWSESGKLASRGDGFQCEGGQFLLGSYKVCVNFDECDGIVEIIWRGQSDFHCTLPSITHPNYTRIGTSLQVSDRLAQRVNILLEMQNKGKNISQKIRGVEEILQQKMKALQLKNGNR